MTAPPEESYADFEKGHGGDLLGDVVNQSVAFPSGNRSRCSCYWPVDAEIKDS